MFSKEECQYTNFRLENNKMEFDVSGENGILISIPFVNDTPQCIKDKLNSIIYQEINKKPDIKYMPCGLLLCARMQVLCYNDKELDSRYLMSVVITDTIDYSTNIDVNIDIFSETSDFRSEFISYCQYRVNKILFPIK